MASQPGVTVHDFGGGGEDPDDPDEGLWHHRLTVTCEDRAGLLADLSEHLRAHEVDIVSAAVATDTESGHIVDSFAVRAAAAPRAAPPRRGWRQIRARQPKGPPWGSGGAKAAAAALLSRRSRTAGGGPRASPQAAGCASCPRWGSARDRLQRPQSLTRACLRVQVRDSKTGGRLSPQILELLCDSLWQVAIGAANPKRLSGGSAAAAAASGASGSARRASSGGSYAALSLTTVAEVRHPAASPAHPRSRQLSVRFSQADSAKTPVAQRRSIDGSVEEEDAVVRSRCAPAAAPRRSCTADTDLTLRCTARRR
jgi:hypothetical protein